MSAHAYHDELPGYRPDQIWHDGCPECEERGQVVYRGIGTLDHANFARAWQRAIDWNVGDQLDMHISACEVALLETLWAVRCQQETAAYIAGVVDGRFF